MEPPLLALDAVSHAYGAAPVLESVTAVIRSGAVGLLGPNGAGKSTLIKILLGLVDASAGEGKVLGHDIRRQTIAVRQRIGYMPENEAMFPEMTGYEAVVYAARLAGLPKPRAIQRAHEVLDYAGVGEERYRDAAEYSTGMKQRVKLASALVHGPEVVFLDEPTNGLDPAGREDMLSLIADLRRVPVNVLLSSHLLDDVERVCDHVLLLVAGRLVHTGPIAEVLSGRAGWFEIRTKEHADRLALALKEKGVAVEAAPDAAETFRAALEDADVDAFWQLAVSLGVQVRHFAPVRVTLEQAFVRMVGDGDGG